jgi:hypothetical protein
VLIGLRHDECTHDGGTVYNHSIPPLVRRFKTLLNRRTRLHEHFSRGSLREQLATSLTRHLSKYLLRQPKFVHGEGVP